MGPTIVTDNASYRQDSTGSRKSPRVITTPWLSKPTESSSPGVPTPPASATCHQASPASRRSQRAITTPWLSKPTEPSSPGATTPPASATCLQDSPVSRKSRRAALTPWLQRAMEPSSHGATTPPASPTCLQESPVSRRSQRDIPTPWLSRTMHITRRLGVELATVSATCPHSLTGRITQVAGGGFTHRGSQGATEHWSLGASMTVARATCPRDSPASRKS